MTTRRLSLWREKLFKLTHALILPLSILVIASLLLGLGNILEANHIKNKLTLLLTTLGNVIFDNLSLLFSIVLVLYFTKMNKLYAVLMLIFSLLFFYSIQSVFISYDKIKDQFSIINLHFGENIRYLIQDNLGIQSLSSSFFGTFSCGAFVIFCMNRFSDFTLPKYLSIFNKERLVPFILLPFIVANSFIFLWLWPYLALGISNLMIASTTLDYGFDAFSFGIITRVLKPFGMHQIFSYLVLETSVGGKINALAIMELGEKLGISQSQSFLKFFNEFLDWNTNNKLKSLVGQREIWNFINSLSMNEMAIDNAGNTLLVLPWFNQHLGIYIGKFSQDYAVYLGMASGISASIIWFAPKDQKRKLLLIIAPAIFISVFNGITEPLEFILLFALPSLYFFLYVPISGFSLMLMNLFNVHIGGNVIRGLMDFISFGILPVAKGTKFWITFPLALANSLVVFAAFYFVIRKNLVKRLVHVDYNWLYLSKTRYENLMQLGFKNNLKVNSENSLRIKINNFLIDGIKSGKWTSGDKFPSEEGLAVQFNCSRLTARSALLKLVENGILFSVKGQGYYLTQYGATHLLQPNNFSLKYDNQTIKIISSQDLSFSNNWLKDLGYEFDNLDIARTHNFEKKYFDTQGNLILYEISILNKQEVFLDDYSQVNQSLLNYLSLQGLKLTNHSSSVIFIDSKIYRHIAQEMGYLGYDYPIVVSVLTSKSKWIEISLQIMPRASFKFSRDYKIIN